MNLLTVLSQHSRQITKPGSTQDLKSGPSDLRAVDPTPNEHQTPSAWQRCGAQPKPPPRTFGRTTREQSSTKCRARRDLAPSVPVVWGRMPPPILTQYRPQGVGCKQPTARSCAPPGARTPETGVRRPRSRRSRCSYGYATRFPKKDLKETGTKPRCERVPAQRRGGSSPNSHSPLCGGPNP